MGDRFDAACPKPRSCASPRTARASRQIFAAFRIGEFAGSKANLDAGQTRRCVFGSNPSLDRVEFEINVHT